MPKNDFSKFLTSSIRVRVPFFDLDPAGVAWHGRYFQYFELARCELLDSVGYGYEEMMSSGVLWPVVDTSVRYLQPLTLNQEVTVVACLIEWEMRIGIDYKIQNSAGSTCTRARTVQVPVDGRTYELILGSPAHFVENVRQKMKEAQLIPE